MACYNGEIGTKFPSGRWEEFCKDRAEVAARHFANEFLQFLRDNPVYDVSGASTTFSKRFVEYFLQAFDSEVHKDGFLDFDAPDSPTDVFGPDDWGSSIHLTGTFKPPEKKTSESSFKFLGKLKDVKGFFKRNVNDELVTAKQAETRRDHHDIDQRLQNIQEAKLTTTVKREGVMNYLMNLESGVNTEDFFWQKCRVVLFKAPGGYMLEFYTPPKVTKDNFLRRFVRVHSVLCRGFSSNLYDPFIFLSPPAARLFALLIARLIHNVAGVFILSFEVFEGDNSPTILIALI